MIINTTRLLITLLLLVSASAATIGATLNPCSPAPVTVRLYFSNPKLPEWANSCGAGEYVVRRTTFSRRPAHSALKLLFAGPTEAEKAKGMESLDQLGKYYIGVSVVRGVAIVNFKRGAEKYLYVNGAACQQEQALTPIENTLKQFPTVKSVKYAINGKVITDWDA
jgi:Sporulation and spore germination